MSLINKMLQDLDARGPQANSPLLPEVKSVTRGGDSLPLSVVIGGIVLALVIGVAAVFGWRAWKRPAMPPAPAPVVVVQSSITPRGSAPAVASPYAPPAVAAKTGAPAAAMPAAAPPRAVAAAAAPMAPAALSASPAPVQASKAAPESAALAATPATKSLADAGASRARAKAPAVAQHTNKHNDKNKLASTAKSTEPHAAPSAPSAAPALAATAPAGGRDMTNSQRAESEYNRAMSHLQEGRVADALAALERALTLEPRHDAARQLLVGLLVEAKRPDDAIRLLQTGLTLEPRQPAMAMLLARLQIERGGTGIDTLMRTLPYAGANGDYHAFLAGALQRQQRHREAAEQYQLALQSAPQQGVWWMGLGISLQAEQRNADALAAFQRARDSGKLSADLQTFVDRKLQQLSHESASDIK